MSRFGRLARPGLLLGLIGTICLAVASTAYGKIISNVGPVLIALLAFGGSSFVSAPLMMISSEWLEASRIQIIYGIITGVLSAAFTLLRLAAMEYVEPLDASALFQLQVLFIIVIARVVLKEHFGFYEVFFAIFIVFGAFFVTQPAFLFGTTVTNAYRYRYVGILLAIGSGAISAVACCIIRLLQDSDVYFVSFMQSLSASVVLLIVYVCIGDFRLLITGGDWLWFSLTLAGGVVGLMIFCKAYMLEEASIITAISATETVFTVILQIGILRVFPNWVSIVGSLMIVLGVIVLALKVKIFACFTSLYRRSSTHTDDQVLEPICSKP